MSKKASADATVRNIRRKMHKKQSDEEKIPSIESNAARQNSSSLS